MIARIPAALLPLLSPLSVRVGQPDSGVMIPIRTGKRVLHFDAGARATYLGMSARDAGGAICFNGSVGAFIIDPDRLYVDTLRPTARDMISRAIADHLGVPGDGPAATERGPDGGWRIARFSFLFDSAPLPIPADTPSAEVIGRAMAALWPDTP
jgi:hypothetical protein